MAAVNDGARLTLGSRWQPHSGPSVLSVSNNSSIVSGGPGKRTSVSDLLLDVAHDSTFRAL